MSFCFSCACSEVLTHDHIYYISTQCRLMSFDALMLHYSCSYSRTSVILGGDVVLEDQKCSVVGIFSSHAAQVDVTRSLRSVR